MRRPNPLPRLVHWLWGSRHVGARVTRALLLPLAGVYGAAICFRRLAYLSGVFKPQALPARTVAVGNRSVGGAGKTPVAAWIAEFYARSGKIPGVLLRGYGDDETLVHQRLVPSAVVVPNADRVAGAALAAERGANVFVLDDALQTLSVARDIDIVLVSAEAVRSVPWLLPAGPWREPLSALERADCLVVTRKRVAVDEARTLAQRLARRWPGIPVAIVHLAIDHLEGMVSGKKAKPGMLKGHRVLAVAGIADPASFAVQIRSLGATVQLVAYQDHHRYTSTDVERLQRLAAGGGSADYVVVTEKDAVKLRHLWPATAREPLVAVLAVRWEHNGEAIAETLTRIL